VSPAGIAAKAVTPFLLSRIGALTEGRALAANIALGATTPASPRGPPSPLQRNRASRALVPRSMLT
jgi:hypothetical protein